jgi:hypothetical protein
MELWEAALFRLTSPIMNRARCFKLERLSA